MGIGYSIRDSNYKNDVSVNKSKVLICANTIVF